jgi:hypothetical protein
MTASTYDPNGTVAAAGGIPAYVTAHSPSVSGKADKVAGATSGNFAGLDASGNLTDSTKKASDFAAASHTHAQSDITGLSTALAGKADKPTIITATLAASATQVVLSGLPSSGTNLIEFYTSVPGLDYTAISVSGTSATLTYEAQSTATTVYAVITEVTS